MARLRLSSFVGIGLLFFFVSFVPSWLTLSSTDLRAKRFHMKNWITHPKVEGRASRQAHCDLPEGTYERELGKEGFFGPASHMYHPNAPTG